MKDEVIDVIKLAELNKKLNSFNELSNVKQVFSGNRDMRDPIIDRLMAGADVYYPINELAEQMSKYYLETYGNNIDFTYFVDFIEQLVRILLKNFKLFEDIEKPRGNMINYLFKQKAGTFDNRIWAYFNRYYQKYFEPFKNHKSYEQLLDNQKYCKDDLDFCESNKFYVEHFESGINRKDTRDLIDDDLEKIDIDIKDVKSEEEEEDKDWYKDDDDILLLHKASHPTTEDTVITKYDIPYQKLRESNIVWSDEEYKEEINKIRDRKIKKWCKFRDESGYLPHDIKRYRVGGNYFKVRNNTKPDHIYVLCRSKEIDFKEIFFDKTIESYLRNTIIKNLSERQQLLIEYLYYEMKPVDNVVSLMGFNSIKALNTEKSRCLKKIRMQILKDYEFIVQEYEETKLDYWARKIKHRHENIYAENGKKLLSI